jgi:hypothetical protein
MRFKCDAGILCSAARGVHLMSQVRPLGLT